MRRDENPPHIFAVAERAWVNMGEERENQSILITYVSFSPRKRDYLLIRMLEANLEQARQKVLRKLFNISPLSRQMFITLHPLTLLFHLCLQMDFHAARPCIAYSPQSLPQHRPTH